MPIVGVPAQELWLIFSKTFRCCSNKCLYGEAGAAALIETFGIGYR